MIAVDTNILVRYYAQDDRDQAAIAERILRDEPAVYVPLTVIARRTGALLANLARRR